MDLSQNENHNRQLILIALFFLIGLVLGILASTMSFQKKIASLQSQIVSLQQLASQKCPASQNVTEPSSMPDIIPPGGGGKIPPPLP